MAAITFNPQLGNVRVTRSAKQTRCGEGARVCVCGKICSSGGKQNRKFPSHFSPFAVSELAPRILAEHKIRLSKRKSEKNLT